MPALHSKPRCSGRKPASPPPGKHLKCVSRLATFPLDRIPFCCPSRLLEKRSGKHRAVHNPVDFEHGRLGMERSGDIQRQKEMMRLGQHFVALDTPGARVIHGYYALSAVAVAFDHVPRELRKRLPRYPVPVAHLGRLAVDRSAAGQRLGEFLLMDALARTLRAVDQIGIHAVEVVAINESARSFYRKYGFRPLKDDRHHLYLPITTVKKLGLV